MVAGVSRSPGGLGVAGRARCGPRVPEATRWTSRPSSLSAACPGERRLSSLWDPQPGGRTVRGSLLLQRRVLSALLVSLSVRVHLASKFACCIYLSLVSRDRKICQSSKSAIFMIKSWLFVCVCVCVCPHAHLRSDLHQIFTPHPVEVAEYCDKCGCLPVCLRAYLRNHTPDLHQIFCVRHLRPRLGSFLTALRFVRYVLPVCR